MTGERPSPPGTGSAHKSWTPTPAAAVARVMLEDSLDLADGAQTVLVIERVPGPPQAVQSGVVVGEQQVSP